MMRNILILFLVSGVMAYASFSKSGDIVTDSITGLEWQDNTIGEEMEWQEAITYCEDLSLGGYSDWRLPNINELRSIVDRDKYNPAIVSAFTNFSSSYYWSSTTYEHNSNNAWIVSFYYGNVSYNNKNDSYLVRCVRAGE